MGNILNYRKIKGKNYFKESWFYSWPSPENNDLAREIASEATSV